MGVDGGLASASGAAAQKSSQIETAAAATGSAKEASATTGQFLGDNGDEGSGSLELLTDGPGNDSGKGSDRVAWSGDVVLNVLLDVLGFQLVDPGGLLVDEGIDFLWKQFNR